MLWKKGSTEVSMCADACSARTFSCGRDKISTHGRLNPCCRRRFLGVGVLRMRRASNLGFSLMVRAIRRRPSRWPSTMPVCTILVGPLVGGSGRSFSRVRMLSNSIECGRSVLLSPKRQEKSCPYPPEIIRRSREARKIFFFKCLYEPTFERRHC